MKRLSKFYLSFLVVFALLLMAACGAVSQQQIEGILQNADSVSGDVTVKLKDGGTVTFNFKDVKVETLRSALGNASLEPGSRVTIEMDKDQKVRRLKAHIVEVEGVIKSLDQGKQTVMIARSKTEG